MKLLSNCKWKPRWVSHLGCLSGCLRYWKSDVTDAWLYGGSGHAFLLNIHDVVCPSGPTAWRKDRYNFCIENIGFRGVSVVGHKAMKDFTAKQQEAWQAVRQAVDRGQPSIAWELEVPEYYLLNGYDEQGYHYSGPRAGSQDQGGPWPWEKLGLTDIGILEVEFPELAPPAPDETVVRDALKFALDFSTTPAALCFPGYHAGLEGFDVWRNALLNNTAHDWGMAYNTAVWGECREMAVEFLREAGSRLAGTVTPLFAEAEKHYSLVAATLKELVNLYPFPPAEDALKDEARRSRGSELLSLARSGEENGLRTLQQIVDALSTGGSDKEARSCD